MKDLFRRMKLDAVMGAIGCIAFGVVLLIWPEQVTSATCQAIGCIIAFLGAVRAAGYLMSRRERNGLDLPLGLMLFFVGAWIALRPRSVASLLMIVIGVLLFVHGLEDLKYALETRRAGYASWRIMLVFGILCMSLGAVCIIDCFGAISVAMTFVGAMLIFDGLTDLWIIFVVVQAAKAWKREAGAAQAQETEAEIVEESEM